MKSKILIFLVAVFLAILTAVVQSVEDDNTKTADELIKQAHAHDNMYTLGPSASQQKALSFYNSALAAEPDEKQRLHILYRMAQLYGSSYDLSKGEKPNFRKAIELNQEIVKSYPPKEPLVYKAASSICDHYTTLEEFESAVKWAKKVLEYDTSQMAEQIRTIEQQKHAFERAPGDSEIASLSIEKQVEFAKQMKQVHILKKALAKMERYQEIAVDQLTYSAELIHPLWAEGELRGVIKRYPDTFISDRAKQHLQKITDKTAKYLEIDLDLSGPFGTDTPALQSSTPAPVAFNQGQKNKGIQLQLDITPKETKSHGSIESNAAEILQKDKYVAKEPRAPPLSYLSKCLIGAAVLIILVLAARLIKKKITPYI